MRGLPGQLSVIIKAASELSNIPATQLVSKSRDHELALIRSAIGVVARVYGHSYPQIGCALNRDHSSVQYSVKKFDIYCRMQPWLTPFTDALMVEADKPLAEIEKTAARRSEMRERMRLEIPALLARIEHKQRKRNPHYKKRNDFDDCDDRAEFRAAMRDGSRLLADALQHYANRRKAGAV